MAGKRKRLVGSIKQELLNKSRESALAAVQIFNNPNIIFKSETYIVLIVIAWTYLLHAYYRDNKIEYRYYKKKNGRRYFDKTKNGACKYWELERCLNDKNCPIGKNVYNNLRFLIELRHEIEHQMTTRIDDFLSARFQACCINYNQYISNLFGDKYGIDKHLSFSLQFSSLSEEQIESMEGNKVLPKHIEKFIQGFDGELANDEFNSPQYAYRVLFVAKTANRKGQADRVVEFVKVDSKLAKEVNTQYVAIKETERKKYLPGLIVKLMKDNGHPNFMMHQHTQLWKQMDAKNPCKGFGVEVVGTWYWYERWLDEVKKHCRENSGQYQ